MSFSHPFGEQKKSGYGDAKEERGKSGWYKRTKETFTNETPIRNQSLWDMGTREYFKVKEAS